MKRKTHLINAMYMSCSTHTLRTQTHLVDSVRIQVLIMVNFFCYFLVKETQTKGHNIVIIS